MTSATTAARPPELDEAATRLRLCRHSLESAHSAMPVMAVAWFGPASDLWRTAAERLRAQAAAAVEAARIAAEQIDVVEP